MLRIFMVIIRNVDERDIVELSQLAQYFYDVYGFTIIGEYEYYVGSHIDRKFIMHKEN